jgi:hypothetical protein
MSAADSEVVTRVTRLLTPPARLPVTTQALICSAAAVLVAVPVTLLVFTF